MHVLKNVQNMKFIAEEKISLNLTSSVSLAFLHTLRSSFVIRSLLFLSTDVSRFPYEAIQIQISYKRLNYNEAQTHSAK